MAKKLKIEDTRVCDDCIIGKWYDVEWNRSIEDGKPLTKHCQYHPEGGLNRGTRACEHYKASV